MMITAKLFSTGKDVLICLEEIVVVYEREEGKVSIELRGLPQEENMIQCKGPLKDWETAFSDWEITREHRNPFISPETIKLGENAPEPEEKG